MTIRRATIADIPAIRAMADVVFRRTYAHILTPEQTDYMMEWMYSPQSLQQQIEGPGCDFFIALADDGTPQGYVSLEPEGTTPDGLPLVHLQKIYVMPSAQGTGLGSRLFGHATAHLRAKHPGGCVMELNVNRQNRAVGFYERMGMTRVRQGDFPIGSGFYMNDYIYSLPLPPNSALRRTEK